MNPRHMPQLLEVQIMDQSYTLSCPENGEAALQAAVAKVDAAMCAIRDAGKIKSRDRIAVLACLNIAHEIHEQQSALDETARQQRLSSLIERLDQTLSVDDSLS